MKVLCDRERLREGLTITTSVIPLKSTRPAIENVCLVATDDALELVGTDLEVAVRYRIEDVKVAEPGTALIPARVAADFVRDLSGETVSLINKGNHFLIESGSDRCELSTIDPDEYPVVARFMDDASLSVQAGTFSRLVQRTSFAAAREPGRYAMHGILTIVQDGQLRMVATDGRRMAMISSPVDTSDARISERRAIVPTKGMQLICRVLSDPLEQIKLQFGESQIGLRTAKAEVFVRIIDGDFPRYDLVIPQSTSNLVEADADLLQQKLRLVSNVASNDARIVRMSLEKGRISLRSRSATTGEATAQIECHLDGTPTEMAFNPDFVIDGLKNCELDAVRFEFNERSSPGKFVLGENYIYIVMPITLDT